MNIPMCRAKWLGAMQILILAAAVPAFGANLLINGDFEASTSGFTAPTGWTNIGPANGVVSYAATNQVAYDGSYFYTLGGPGTNGYSAIDWGISQSVSTVAGNTYRLTFGYTGENGPGLETVLGVNIGATQSQYTLTATNDGYFQRAFVTTQLDYVATGSSTAISFILLATNEPSWAIGNNDPIIDKVMFEQIAAGSTSDVPEPGGAFLLASGLTVLAFVRRRMQDRPRPQFLK